MSWTPPRTISVVIATHNRLTELDALLHDLANQTVSAHEVIVVDSDAAADSRPLVEFHARRGLNVKHLITENVVAIKRNAGAARASGGLVVFLDDDLRVGRGFLAAHLAAHRQPRIVASGKSYVPRRLGALEQLLSFQVGPARANKLVDDRSPAPVRLHE